MLLRVVFYVFVNKMNKENRLSVHCEYYKGEKNVNCCFEKRIENHNRLTVEYQIPQL